MKAGKVCRLTWIALCIFFWQGTIGAQTPAPTPVKVDQSAPTGSEFNFIHLGDLVEIEVVGYLDYYWRGSLTPEGFLNGPDKMEENVFALCREEQEVAAEIAKILGKMLREPKVVVRILDRSNRSPTTVYGAVRAPQRFRLKRLVTLNELIVLSGGFTDKASGEIQIFRAAGLSCTDAKKTETVQDETVQQTKNERFVSASQNTGSQIFNIKIADLLSGKREANLPILGGDVVTVLEAQPIYVIGGVNSPKQIATRSQITVSRAVSSAGGLTRDADPTKVTIFRRAAGETRIIEVDLEKIKIDSTADFVLQPFDIVEVTQKGREKRKFPPSIKVDETGETNPSKLPLRVID